MKLIKNIIMIVFNVRRPLEACLASIPKNGEVTEHDDRYEYSVTNENGTVEMIVYKHETISVEIKYNDSKYSIEEQLARKHKDNEECLDRLQELVQEKIIPIDPALVIVKLQTIDKAIKYYIELLEIENRELKKNASNIN